MIHTYPDYYYLNLDKLELSNYLILNGGAIMSKVLYIKANCKPVEASRTFRIAGSFIEAYKQKHPDDEIITLDLYKENIRFLTAEDLSAVFEPKTDESRNHPILKYTYQFAEADKYVFAEPMWNLGVPAILKAYIDYITVTGITFKYTEHGAAGLLTGKKAVNIVTRGGDYTSEPMSDYEMGERYLRTILGFLGVTDFVTISADRLDIIGEDVEAIVGKAVKEAESAAAAF